MNKNIAVIGAGNGGTAIAGYLSLCGAPVNICDLFPEYIEGMKAEGGIYLEKDGKKEFARLNVITDKIDEAIKGVKLIMVVTPAFTHNMIAKACSRYLEDGQIVILNPGRTLGAFEFLNCIRQNGCSKDVVVAETQTLIYSCRKKDNITVNILGVKKRVDIASIPSDRVMDALNEINEYYPQFVPAENILYTGLTNIGSMFHPAPMLMNIGRIETDKAGFEYYMDGMSPSVSKAIEEIDKERVAVAKGFGIAVPNVKEWLMRSYNTYGDNLYELIHNNSAYKGVAAPKTIQARYVTEDVPMGLVPISELGKSAGVETPIIDSVIKLAGVIYCKDFRKEGRSLENLGISGADKNRILRYIEKGK